jgi:hypothetical protein
MGKPEGQNGRDPKPQSHLTGPCASSRASEPWRSHRCQRARVAASRRRQRVHRVGNSRAWSAIGHRGSGGNHRKLLTRHSRPTKEAPRRWSSAGLNRRARALGGDDQARQTENCADLWAPAQWAEPLMFERHCVSVRSHKKGRPPRSLAHRRPAIGAYRFPQTITGLAEPSQLAPVVPSMCTATPPAQ